MSRRSMLPMLLLLAASFGFVGCSNEPPQAVISSPQNGQHFVPSESITFSGTAEDEEDGLLEGGALVWTSDQDGQIGTGTTFQNNTLSAATHRITLTAEDGDGESGSAEITIIVNSAPTAAITAPSTGSLFATTAAITFEGTGMDGPDNPLSGASLVWSSDHDGVFGTGTTVVTDALSENTHGISLTAIDSAGDTTSVSIVVVVSDSPLPTITTPANGARFDRLEDIVFTGSARDAQDGTLPGSGLTWSSDLDGEFAVGSPDTMDSLSQGTHVITLTATDSDNQVNQTTIAVIIEPVAPPTVTILQPHSGTFFTSADTVTFRAEAADAQDGELTGAALIWYSDRQNDAIGEGAVVQTADLAPGTHIITLRATDSEEEYGLATIYVHIDAPQVQGFAMIPGGTFTMGSSAQEWGHSSDETQHVVTLNRGFYLWTSEVTEALWAEIMGGPSSSLPVVNVTWDQAVEFCNLLSSRDGLTPAYADEDPTAVYRWSWNQEANGYRLPTEAEWEYACRGGTVTAFASGDIIDGACDEPNLAEIGWYCGNSGNVRHAAGSASSDNAWGLSDMHGNVWEWCWDFEAAYPPGTGVDPVGPQSGAFRIRRGGSYESWAQYCRSANRSSSAASDAEQNLGFRIARWVE